MMPSALNVEKQAQLVSAAWQCLSEIGKTLYQHTAYVLYRLTLSPIKSKEKMVYASSIKPEQPASNMQAVQVLCCLLLIFIQGLVMNLVKLESSKKGFKIN